MKYWLSITFKVLAWLGLILCISVAYLGAMGSYEDVDGVFTNIGRDWFATCEWCVYGILAFVGFMLLAKLAKAAQIKIDNNAD